MKEVILGVCPSKSNCYRINGKVLYKTRELVQYERAFLFQCKVYKGKYIAEKFGIELKVYYPNNRSDLDNSLKVILDCLQKAKAIKNDNLCMKISAEKFIDKLNPRIEFSLNSI